MIFDREPALFIGAINAIILLGVGFGLPVSSEQLALIMTAVTAITAFITRKVVTSNTTLEEDYIPRPE